MNNQNKNTGLILSILAIFLLIGTLFAYTVYPEHLWMTIAFGVLLAGDLGALLQVNRNSLRSRAVAYGTNSLITVLLVLGIIGVLNFLSAKYPKKLDLTKNKVNTLSDQTVKLVKGLQQPVTATAFVEMRERETVKSLLDRYRAINPKFEVEIVDPRREPTRARAAGIKRSGTIDLKAGARDSKVEPEVNEEKLTNALIKLLKDKQSVFCAITGHGERSFNASDAEGMSQARKMLGDQDYDFKEVNILQSGNKIPDTCDTISLMGVARDLFPTEAKAVTDYLANGGRAVVASELAITKSGGDADVTPNLDAILAAWNLKPVAALVVDPTSQMLNLSASIPFLQDYNKQSPITKGFAENVLFPLTRPIDLTTTTVGVKSIWLAKTTAAAFGVTDMKELASGRIRQEPGKDIKGPLIVAASAEGKPADSKAKRNTRVVLFGSSTFATNGIGRNGGNMDFFMNSVSWLMEDESMISIRSKEEDHSKVELTQKAGVIISWLTVIIVPLLIAVGGIITWVLRRRL